jgi:1-acyl-sn-glycerol-3-phosphate acyltransferase
MTPTVPAALPRRGTSLTRAVGHLAMRVLGWRFDGNFPDRRKLVLIVAPHRSNWDFVVGLAAKMALGIEVAWLGKHTLFRGPLGALFRYWGGISVDRTQAHDTVASVVAQFAAHDALMLTVTPEGTRKSGSRWKTGFWHIAHGAGVPIVPLAFDWGNKVIRIMPMLQPTALEPDMADLQARYAAIRGHHD